MFEVICISPLDDCWGQRDIEISEAAGINHDCSSAVKDRREHNWYVKTFAEALALRGRLEKVAGCNATIREKISELHPKRRRR